MTSTNLPEALAALASGSDCADCCAALAAMADVLQELAERTAPTGPDPIGLLPPHLARLGPWLAMRRSASAPFDAQALATRFGLDGAACDQTLAGLVESGTIRPDGGDRYTVR